jgi:VWFA-related protein
MPRRRPWVLGVPGLFTLLTTTAGAQAPAQPPTFPTEVELITVDAVVVDDAGRPVPGLTRDEFVVEAEGEVQEIATFEAFSTGAAPAEPGSAATAPTTAPRTTRAQGGRLFALVVDDAGMTAGEAKDLARALARFVDVDLRDGDEATLWTTSGDAWWSARIPEGRADLLAMFSRLKGRGVAAALQADYISDYEAFYITNHDRHARGPLFQRVSERWLRTNACLAPNSPRASQAGAELLGGRCAAVIRAQAAAVNADRQRRARLLLGTVQRATTAFASMRGRKSLLLFSAGFISDRETDVRDVSVAAREANTAVYFLDSRGLTVHAGLPGAAESGAAPDPTQVGAMGFEVGTLGSTGAQDLAEETGGVSIRNTNDLAGAAARVAAEARDYYLLGFYPPAGTKAGVWRKLKVSVKRKGLQVRARRGFVLRDVTTAVRSERKGADPVAVRALDGVHEIAEIPMRAMAYVQEPKSNETTRVLVLAEVDAARLAFERSGQQRMARFELTVLATHRDTGRAIGSDGRIEVRLTPGEAPGWRAASQELELPTGVSQVRVIVVDQRTKRVGAVTQRIDVPPAGTLRVSTPVLTNVLRRFMDGTPPEPALTAQRVFRPEGNLYCRFEVFGALRESGTSGPRVSMGVELRTADGRVVREGAATPVATGADGRVVRTLGIGIADLAEGAYDLVLQVHDAVSGQRLEQHEPFTLARESASF